ncbi:MAG: sodium:solute symporter, partial [Planctomycetes bacterium]|nr:sodium:solute symporter [Planctomycetota bacterium]
NGLPWDGGEKVWHANIYEIADPSSSWRPAGTLPQPLAYGAALFDGEQLWLIGGCDSHGATEKVWRGQKVDGLWSWKPAPPLPRASSFHRAALLEDQLFVLPGGTDSSGAQGLTSDFWSLNVKEQGAAWQAESPFPGTPRAKASMVTQKLGDGQVALFVFGGESPTPDGAGPGDGILQDAWRFLPNIGWQPLPALPAPTAAAPAVAVGASHILLFPGDDGSLRRTDPAVHPGFPNKIHAFHTITDTWALVGEHPSPVVTTTVLSWADAFTFVSGETRPGVRTPALTRVRLAKPVPALSWLDWTVLALYLAALVAMGSWFARRNKKSDDFFVAGQRIPWWAAGLSIYGTQLSAITFLATPALAFATDMRYAPTWLGILFVVPLITRVFLPYFRRLDIRTAYEYLEHRFSRTVRQVGSASFVVMQTARMGIVVYLPALALSMVTGLDVRMCIAVTGVLATMYTVLGGMEAVVWTDVLQVFVL